MRGWIVGLAVSALAMPAFGQPARPGPGPADAVGRYQVLPVPAPEGNATGNATTVIMVDTATGQSWMLVQTPGPPIQWAPLRFLTPGNPATLTPLPPAPNAVGNRPATEGAPGR